MQNLFLWKMKVVNGLENESLEKEQTESQSGYVRIKKFHFVMLLFVIVFFAAGITAFALAFGDEKAVKVESRSEFDKLYKVYDTLNEKYYKKVNKEELVNGAVNGMVESLGDPYSDYMNVSEAKNFQNTISSSFEGIGAQIEEKDDQIVVVAPIKGSPAEKAGLKPEDKVLSVNGTSLQGKSSTEAVNLIRGKKGTKVELEIARPGMAETMKLSIVRDTIPVQTVYGKMLPDGIGEVQITTFSQSTTKELTDTLNDLQKQGMKGLVLDLRHNPGGLMDQAINISSMFVPKGKIIFQIEDRNGQVQKIPSNNNKSSSDLPLVVIIDKGSASASEILSAALHESANIPLIGEKSFGKGTVQEAKGFSDGSNLKITIDKWLTPDGSWIHEKGIEPDYQVALPEFANILSINPDSKLMKSTASNEVKSVQAMLKALGYDPGREDGFFDDQTEKAVKKFQKTENLSADGIVTGQTSIKLMEKLGQLIEQNDTQLNKAVEVLKEQMNNNQK